jgi:hypothetical protein
MYAENANVFANRKKKSGLEAKYSGLILLPFLFLRKSSLNEDHSKLSSGWIDLL